MPSWVSSGRASTTSLNACWATAMRLRPSMSRARIEPLTSSTSSTRGGSAAVSSSARAAWAAAASRGRAGRRRQQPDAGRPSIVLC